jgi:hypothetical protein
MTHVTDSAPPAIKKEEVLTISAGNIFCMYVMSKWVKYDCRMNVNFCNLFIKANKQFEERERGFSRSKYTFIRTTLRTQPTKLAYSPVLTVLSWLSWLAVLSWQSSYGCFVLSVLSQLSRPCRPVLVVLPCLAILFWLPWADCPDFTVLLFLSLSGCPVLLVILCPVPFSLSCCSFPDLTVLILSQKVL